ncbi:DUF2835 domain-containing protein [Endozoicomonas sp. G2_2]|uniref:DUF2835 family protein n=1 Tax=Endozoicomonas sp. G2_2 TaxID=2821092 RepID=UPI001AD9725A|nr:DUF2835 family protein [Endozoicomonas sp. G2_2]MBO9470391.1 DUF2835 domain-containing protein [Endozoicomonas sp. G2_2]
MPSIDVVIELSAAQCQAHYAGAIDHVYARSVDGRRVLLPAHALRKVVMRDGVHGIYRLAYDAGGRFQSLRRIGDSPTG